MLTARRAVELIRWDILRQHPEATEVNAVLIDFLLYDLAKEREASGKSHARHVCSEMSALASIGCLGSDRLQHVSGTMH